MNILIQRKINNFPLVAKQRGGTQGGEFMSHREPRGSIEFHRQNPLLYLLYSSKKSFPLSSVIMKAGMFSTRICLIASIPRSLKSIISTDLIFSAASIAAGPPIDPR